jgi:hypothetical protein
MYWAQICLTDRSGGISRQRISGLVGDEWGAKALNYLPIRVSSLAGGLEKSQIFCI